MFTGIIGALGQITQIESLSSASDAGVRLSIATDCPLDDVALGDSIAVNGVCLTVIAKDNGVFQAEVSRATLACTTGLEQLGAVNLEKALRLQDRLGGHLVAGHIDGTGTVVSFAAVGESWQLVIHAPLELGKYLAYKGSVTIQGVSLTINTVRDLDQTVEFSVNLIPHTLQQTTLQQLSSGMRVNLEVDLIARYLERMLATTQGGSQSLQINKL